ncbi:MAG TPA: hypothetical protein VFH51_18850 [Myxococcota bacterium]|nr:hypothetical protein [Myxococcota bacterium]
MPALPTNVHYTDDAFCVGVAPPAICIVWAGEMRSRHHDAIRQCLTDLLRRQPSCIALNLFTHTFQLPGVTMLKQAEAMGRELAPHAHLSAAVVEGEGLRTGTIRTMLSAILLASRTKAPNRVFARLSDALGWVAEQPQALPRTTGRADLDAFATALRGRFP